MPGWLKALLIVLAVVVLLVVGLIGAGAVWWMRNKDALRARAKEIVAEGKDFGKTTDNQGCVDEAVARYKKEPGFLNAFSNQGFLKGCLEASRPTPGFCDNIPVGELMKMKEWQESQCPRYNLETDRNCQTLLMSIAMYCSDRAKGKG